VSLEKLIGFDWVFQPAGSLLLTLVMVARSGAISPVSVEVAAAQRLHDLNLAEIVNRRERKQSA
jgi:hypothetical protein